MPSRSELTTWILSTKEAQQVRQSLQSEQELARMCHEDPSLRQQMQSNNLSSERVARELYRSEWLKATLAQASVGVPAPTEAELRQFYRSHPERWISPEKRRLSHILITVQERYAENSETEAQRRIERLRAEASEGAAFGELALANSECPSALHNGELGWVSRGQLFAPVEEVSFALREAELSPAVRSELGWHVVLCHEIQAQGYLPFSSVADQLAQSLHQRRRIAAQKRWVKQIAKERTHAN